jgi:hypothetical protein
MADGYKVIGDRHRHERVEYVFKRHSVYFEYVYS